MFKDVCIMKPEFGARCLITDNKTGLEISGKA